VALPQFLISLFEDGRVTAPAHQPIASDELAAAVPVLRRYETIYRDNQVAGLPDFNVEAGIWSAVRFYRACQFVVHRDCSEDAMAGEFNTTCPGGNSPAVHYSVDVVLQQLPGLFQFAAAASANDPLLGHLASLAACWPLSSVGFPIKKAGTVCFNQKLPDALADSPALLQMYTGRVIAHGDFIRLTDARVAACARAALGAFPDTHPGLSEALQKYDSAAGSTDTIENNY